MVHSLKPGQQVEDVLVAEKDREEALSTRGLWVVRLRTCSSRGGCAYRTARVRVRPVVSPNFWSD